MTRPTPPTRASQLADTVAKLQTELEELRQRGVSVIVKQHDEYVAMIGDRTIHVGDEINGFTVTAIEPDGVRVERKVAAMSVRRNSDPVIADCGLRIADASVDPKSEIRHPKSLHGAVGRSAALPRSLRDGRPGCAGLLSVCRVGRPRKFGADAAARFVRSRAAAGGCGVGSAGHEGRGPFADDPQPASPAARESGDTAGHAAGSSGQLPSPRESKACCRWRRRRGGRRADVAEEQRADFAGGPRCVAQPGAGAVGADAAT